MMTSADAKALARIQHIGQVDQGGAPYIGHVERVAHSAERRAEHALALGLAIDPDEIAQAAWLHDVVEDTSITSDLLLATGYSEPVVTMVQLLTKPQDGSSYELRIAKIIESGNLGAILIKLSDNEDNASPERPLPAGSTLPARCRASMARLVKAAEAMGYTEQ